jgi:hypothetical protein
MEFLLPAWTKIKFGWQISVVDTVKIFGTFGAEMCNVQMYTSCKRLIKILSDSYITFHNHQFFSCGGSTRFRFSASNYGASRSHPFDTQHSVGILWTSDQPEAETSTWQHTTLIRDRLPCLRWDSNTQSQQASSHSTARSLGSAAHQVNAISQWKQQCLTIAETLYRYGQQKAGKWDSIPSRARDCLFSAMSRPALWPTEPAIQWVTENIPQGVNRRGTYN